MKDKTIDSADFLPTDMNTTSGIIYFNSWSEPQKIRVDEYFDRIEIIYKETSLKSYTTYPALPPEERVFKIIFSCKDGKFHKSDRIYGEIIPAKEEKYKFNDE